MEIGVAHAERRAREIARSRLITDTSGLGRTAWGECRDVCPESPLKAIPVRPVPCMDPGMGQPTRGGMMSCALSPSI